MEETAQNGANEIKPVSDTLLVLSKDTNKIEMVKGVDHDGNLQKIPPHEKKDNDQLIRLTSTVISSPTSFPISTGSLKILRNSISSRSRNTMRSTQPKTFSTMSIRHHLKKRKS